MSPEDKSVLKFILIVVAILVGIITLFASTGMVGAGERGVKVRMGKIVGTLDQGIYTKLPFIESVTKIDVRPRTVKNEFYENENGKVLSNNPLESASKDLQDVRVSVVVSYIIDASKVREMYEKYRDEENFEEKILKPVIKKEIKEVTSMFTAEELVTKRAEYNALIDSNLTEEFANLGVFLDQANITNLKFSDSFNQAIEAKVTAEQQALKAQNDLKRIEFEAQQKIVSAEAEAETIRIQAQAINSQGGADYVNLKAVEKWNGALPTQFIPGSSMPFINVR